MKKKITLVISMILLMTIIPLMTINPVTAGPEQITLNCGSIIITKFGDGEEGVTVEVTAISHDIEILFEGADVTFIVDYEMNNIYGVADCAYVRANDQTDQCDSGSKSDQFIFERSFDYNGGVFSIDLWGQYCDWIGVPYVEWCKSDSEISTNTFTWVVPENHPPTVSKPSGDAEVEIGHGIHPGYDTVEYRDYTSNIADEDGNLIHWDFNYGNGNGNDYSDSVRTTVGWSEKGTYYVTCTVTDFPKYPDHQPSYTRESPHLKVKVKYWYDIYNAYSYALNINVEQDGAEAFVSELTPGFNTMNAEAYGILMDCRYEDGIYDTFYCQYLDDQVLTVDVLDTFSVDYIQSFDVYVINADEDRVIDAMIPASEIDICNENPWEEQH